MATNLVRNLYIETSTGQIHARTVSGDGTPIIFLHQTACSSRSFLPLLETLKVAGRLIALDTPGFGESFAPAGWPDITDYVGWLMQAIDMLGIEKFHLFGHHTGANLAMVVAARYPLRLCSLMLMGPAFMDAEERAEFERQLREPIAPRADGAHLLSNWRYASSHNPGCTPEQVHDEVTGMLQAWRARPQAYRAIARHDAMAVAAQLELPILLLSAPGDYFHARLDQARAHLPHAELAIVGGDNFAPAADPDGVALAIRRHLARVEQGTGEPAT